MYVSSQKITVNKIPDIKVHGENMGLIWGQQDPGGPHVGPINFAIWDMALMIVSLHLYKQNTPFKLSIIWYHQLP